MLIEEMANQPRGFAVGLLGALSSLGFGMAALAYSRIDVIPLGWRGLYVSRSASRQVSPKKD
jgi:hypothetical protein